MRTVLKRLMAILLVAGILGASGAFAYANKTIISTSSSHSSNAAKTQYEKPGCGNEQNIGISGNSGAHGGQPPKSEERGDCPHDPGYDGN